MILQKDGAVMARWRDSVRELETERVLFKKTEAE